MKILTLDIETSPNLAYVWGLWNENISIDRIVASSEMLCWAAKWHGEKKVHFADRRDESMTANIHQLMEKADAIVHYNGNSFDIPVLNKEFLYEDLLPPSPSKQIDLYRVVRKKFRFPSNKLDYVVQALGIGKKQKHAGFETWLGCIDNDDKSWNLMQRYNKQDVLITEQLFDRLLPWIDSMPNRQLYDEPDGCPRCGEDALTKQGFAYTRLGQYQRYQCVLCGGWSRGSRRISGVEEQAEI